MIKRDAIYILQKTISEIKETAEKERVSYFLQSQINRALDMVGDLANYDYMEEDGESSPYVLPW